MELPMSVEVIVLFVFAAVSGIASVLFFRHANRLRAAGKKDEHYDQGTGAMALGFLSVVLFIVATHNLG